MRAGGARCRFRTASGFLLKSALALFLVVVAVIAVWLALPWSARIEGRSGNGDPIYTTLGNALLGIGSYGTLTIVPALSLGLVAKGLAVFSC
jgi:hypothetical protein